MRGCFARWGESVHPKLDRFFEKLTGWALPNFTVVNEPDFCAPYAYLSTGKPWKTQQVIDRVRQEAFTKKPDGLPGNDDLGATSAVYVWNLSGDPGPGRIHDWHAHVSASDDAPAPWKHD